MTKILDLSAYLDATFDIKLPNGKMLHIKKPSQKMAIHLMALSQLDQKDGPSVLGGVMGAVEEILNHNTEEVPVNVDSLDYSMSMAVLQGYSEWMQELQESPNA